MLQPASAVVVVVLTAVDREVVVSAFRFAYAADSIGTAVGASSESGMDQLSQSLIAAVRAMPTLNSKESIVLLNFLDLSLSNF